jgi:hypothetical protein
LVSGPNPSQTGQPVTLSATVVGDIQTPNGEVIFRDGQLYLGAALLDDEGTAILNIASLQPGSHSITAEYLGGPNHGASASAPLIQTVGNFHTLTYTAGPNGSLVGKSPQQVIEGDNGSEVTAAPDLGYRFVQWSDASIANPRTDTDVTENLSVEAQFGIDPAEMDPAVLAHPGFTHLRARAKDVKRRVFRDCRWLVMDANVAPNYTLDTLDGLLTQAGVRPQGLVLTLKLTDPKLAERLPMVADRIRRHGYRRVRMRQLAFNRQEICAIVTDG